MIKVLVLQRESLVARDVPSLSVSARVVEVLDYLKDTKYLDYFTISEKDPLAYSAVKFVDFIFFSKHNSLEALELIKFANKNGVKTIYDIDDWIFSFPSYSGGTKNNKLEIIKEIISLVDYVTVANEVILTHLNSYRIDSILIPNGIYLEKYLTNKNLEQLSKYQRKKKIVFTNADLLKVDKSKDMLINVLQEFFTKNPDFILDFYGDPFPEMFSMPFLHFTNRISYDDYMHSLINGDYIFAITPLGGDEEDKDSSFFNSCKNPFKYFNYATALIPCIYSDTYIYRNVIEHNKTGILIQNNYSEWIYSLNELSNNKNLAKKIALNSYQDVKENHHIKIAANILKERIFCEIF